MRCRENNITERGRSFNLVLEEKNQEEQVEQLNQIGQMILRASRDELYIGMRFLDVALSSFVYQMTTEISPFGTDGWNMYFHPKELGGLYRQNRIFVNRGYLHMVYHCLFRHMLKIVPEAKNSTKELENADLQAALQFAQQSNEQRYWNLACDIATEYLVDACYHRSVRWSRSLLRRETYRKLEQAEEKQHVANGNKSTIQATGKTNQATTATQKKRVLNAERIYKQLLEWELSEKELGKLEAEFYVDDHRYWENQNPNQNSPNPNLNQKWQDIDEQMETDLETFSKEASDKAGDLLGTLTIENRQKQDYREFLRKFAVVREEMGVDADTFDYTFYSYGLSLYGNMPLIEPVETREVKKIQDFVIVLDTSMSCSGETVQKFLKTTYDVLSGSENFFQKVNVHIIQCDEKVHSDQKITNQEDLKQYMEHLTLYGEGGTDFRPAFEYVNELIRNNEFEDLRGLIYFTDGYGIYPKKMPPYQTAFVFLEEDYEEANVPAWAMKTILE